MKIHQITYLIIIAILLISCNTSKKVIDEGVIEYQIQYLDLASDDLLLEILPETLQFKYTNTKTMLKVESLGFCLRQIFDKKSENICTTLKMWNKKYIYQTNLSDFRNQNTELNIDRIDYILKDTLIAGFFCKKANIILRNNTKPIEIFYTADLQVNNPNIFTPFHEIEGVLMQFPMKINNMNVMLTAKNVENYKIPDEEFAIPNGYVPLTFDELKKIFESLNPNAL